MTFASAMELNTAASNSFPFLFSPETKYLYEVQSVPPRHGIFLEIRFSCMLHFCAPIHPIHAI